MWCGHCRPRISPGEEGHVRLRGCSLHGINSHNGSIVLDVDGTEHLLTDLEIVAEGALIESGRCLDGFSDISAGGKRFIVDCAGLVDALRRVSQGDLETQDRIERRLRTLGLVKKDPHLPEVMYEELERVLSSAGETALQIRDLWSYFVHKRSILQERLSWASTKAPMIRERKGGSDNHPYTVRCFRSEVLGDVIEVSLNSRDFTISGAHKTMRTVVCITKEGADLMARLRIRASKGESRAPLHTEVMSESCRFMVKEVKTINDLKRQGVLLLPTMYNTMRITKRGVEEQFLTVLCRPLNHVYGVRLFGFDVEQNFRDNWKSITAFLTLSHTLLQMHRLHVFHLDMKIDNVIISFEGLPRLIDFGLSRTLSRKADDQIHDGGMVCGTMGYVAPEVIKRCISNQTVVRGGPVDMFAFGVSLTRLLMGRMDAFTYQKDFMKTPHTPKDIDSFGYVFEYMIEEDQTALRSLHSSDKELMALACIAADLIAADPKLRLTAYQLVQRLEAIPGVSAEINRCILEEQFRSHPL